MRKLFAVVGSVFLTALAIAVLTSSPAPLSASPVGVNQVRECKACTSKCGCMGYFWMADGVCSGPQWPPPYEHCTCLAIWGAEGVEVADGPGLYTEIIETPGIFEGITLRHSEDLPEPDQAKKERLASYQRYLAEQQRVAFEATQRLLMEA